MKRFTRCAILAGACAVAAGLVPGAVRAAEAQQPQAASSEDKQLNEAVGLARAGFQGDYKQIVAANMELSPDEATKFWPVFDQYRAAMTKVNDRLVAVIVGYAKNQTTLTDAQASQMVDEFMKFEREKAETRGAWVPKFAAVLPGKKLARFVQVENKIDALVKVSLAQEVPLVK
jgi:hypothetical protein